MYATAEIRLCAGARIGRTRQIAFMRDRIGQGPDVVEPFTLSKALVADEEECLVFGDGTSEAAPKLVADERWNRFVWNIEVIFFASNASLRKNSKSDPCSAFWPDFVIICTIAPALRPYSAL